MGRQRFSDGASEVLAESCAALCVVLTRVQEGPPVRPPPQQRACEGKAQASKFKRLKVSTEQGR
jgi:hypothetical protein